MPLHVFHVYEETAVLSYSQRGPAVEEAEYNWKGAACGTSVVGGEVTYQHNNLQVNNKQPALMNKHFRGHVIMGKAY